MTKIEQAIDLIRRQGSARSQSIADLLGVKTTAVSPMLIGPVQAGYLVTCRVEIPGKHPTNEYRLSASVSESKVSWEEFKIAARNKLMFGANDKPLKQPPARPPRTPAEAAPMVEIPAPRISPRPPTKMQQPPVVPAEMIAAEPSHQPQRITFSDPIPIPATIATLEDTRAAKILFMVDSNGQLRMERDGHTTLFSKEHTCAMGDLLVATAPIWSHA